MKNQIHTKNSPAPIGNYSQAILKDQFLFVSGQIGINAATGKRKWQDISQETQQVMENIKAILEEADMTFKNVVKASIYLMQIDDFHKVDEIFGSYFDHKSRPAREAFQVAGLPKEMNVEISIIAMA